MFNKLKTKIVLIIFLTLSTTSAGNYFIGNYLLRTELLEAVTAKGFATGQGLKTQVERLLSYGLSLEELTGFDELCVEVTKKNNDIEHTMVVDLKGEVLFNSSTEYHKSISNLPELLVAYKDKMENVVEYTENNERFLGFVIPIFNSHDRHVGSVVLVYPKQNIVKNITKVAYLTLIVTSITLAIAMTIIILSLSCWVTEPLLRLHNATKEIFYNGTKAMKTVEVTTKDEIGRLASSFNTMVTRLNMTTVSKDYLDNIISSMTDALIVISPNNTIETINEATIDILGYTEKELLGNSIDIIFSNSEEIPFEDGYMDRLKKQGQVKNYETKFRTKNGFVFPVLLCCSVMRSKEMDVEHIVCTARDITDIKKAEEIMSYQANYDMLTGLANRHYLESQMTSIMNKIGNSGQCHTFLFLDLDKFKIVNDACGHHAGDQLLKHLSFIMKESLKSNDILARLGGDEFGVLLKNTNIAEGHEIGENICKIIANFRFSWKDKLFSIGVSIGAVEINKENNDIEWILSAADRACYISKDKGGNRVQIFDKSDKELLERQEEVTAMTNLTKALEENRFLLNYQPIVPIGLDEGEDKYEVLIRMIDEKGRIIQPGGFLPAAQRYNMMQYIDQWVIQNFMSTYSKIISYLPNGSSTIFNINISGISLSTSSFLDFICDKMDKYDVPPEVLCFEITETSAVSNFVNSNQFIQKLRAKGCSFALDDFGSGLSSFAYLKHLPVDYIKIDGTFIKNIVNNRLDYVMVSSINDIAHSMGMKTIGEYVENEEIYNCLKEIGIDYAQGYWLGKPNVLEKSRIISKASS